MSSEDAENSDKNSGKSDQIKEELPDLEDTESKTISEKPLVSNSNSARKS